MSKINLSEAFASFSDCWSPKVAGDINDMQIKLAKLSGEFIWHHHDLEDELFLVVSGRLLMRFRDKDVYVDPGEFIIVPKGVEHLPIAEGQECHVVLIEPKTTLNTGTVVNERTVKNLDRLS
ncbi:MAG TPA: cupin domain-containing protein [Blastocatellia bacterium]|nr:cupin domain-containing protein [Blastocatellia bacterium]